MPVTKMPEVDLAELEVLAKSAAARVLAGKTPTAAVVDQLRQGRFTTEHAQRVVEMTNRELLAQHLAGAKTAQERKQAIPLARIEGVLQKLGKLPNPNLGAGSRAKAAAAAVVLGRDKVENSLELIFGQEFLEKVAEAPQRDPRPAALLRERLKAAQAQLATSLDRVRPLREDLEHEAFRQAKVAFAAGSGVDDVLTAAHAVSDNQHVFLGWAERLCRQVGHVPHPVGAKPAVNPEHPLVRAYAAFEKTALLEERLHRGRRALEEQIGRFKGVG